MRNVKALPGVTPAVEQAVQPVGELRRSASLINRFLIGQHRTFGMALVMLILESLTSIGAKYPLKWLIDYLQQGSASPIAADFAGAVAFIPAAALAVTQFFLGLSTPGVLIFLSTMILLIALLNSACDSFAEIYLVKGGRRLGFQVRAQLYEHLQKLSLAFFGRQRTGDLLARVTGDVTALEEFAVKSLKDIAGSLFLIVLTLGVLFITSWQMGLIALVTVPILSLASNYFADKIKSGAKKQRAREGELASVAQEMLTSIRVIQTYGSAGDQQHHFAATSQNAMDVAVQVGRLQAWFGGVISFLQAVVVVIIVWVSVSLVGAGAITFGATVLFISLIQDLFKPTKRIIKQWNEVGKIIASTERIGEVLDRKPAVQNHPGAIEAPPFSGQIEYRHVSFAYQSEEDHNPVHLALHDINLQIAPGEVVALVGGSGAGKSTIAQLLPRLYDPHAGQILIDGQDIREFTLESLRARMSMVLQETILFTGTVADNIAYGRAHATREEIIAAALQANAHEFIEQLPQGYDTPLSERAANLSGGQRQRLAIARAFIRNTPILILDEPTTGLDAESSDLVLLALRSLMKQKSTLIISHDLNLIRHADRIVVIKNGRIDQVGTHRELLKTGGLYAELYHRQFDKALEEQTPALQPAQADEDAPVMPHRIFQTMIAHALPSPVSHPAFETLLITPQEHAAPQERAVGGAAPAAQSLAISFEPADSVLLRDELPGLATALDADSMRDFLQAALFDRGRLGATITHCTCTEAAVLLSGQCMVRYELEVQTSQGRIAELLVIGRVLPGQLECALYMRDRIGPLMELLRGRQELELFYPPAAMLEPLDMVVYAYPIDGELPTLAVATDPKRVSEIITEAISAEQPLSADQCQVELVDYGRQGRATLRYRIAERVIYGKLNTDGSGATIRSIIASLREQIGTRFTIPRVLAWRPDLQLTLLEEVPGKHLIAALLKSQPPGSTALNDLIDQTAWIGAAIHTSGIRSAPRRTFDDELDLFHDELGLIQRYAPEFGTLLDMYLRRIAAYAEQSDPLTLRLCHGDFTHGQILFDGQSAGLIDFDSVCQAEPALDLAQFQIYLRIAARKAGHASQPLEERFLATYVTAASDGIEDIDRLRVRIAVYRMLSLLRRSMRSWQKMKGKRAAQAVALLEEELTCLPPLDY